MKTRLLKHKQKPKHRRRQSPLDLPQTGARGNQKDGPSHPHVHMGLPGVRAPKLKIGKNHPGTFVANHRRTLKNIHQRTSDQCLFARLYMRRPAAWQTPPSLRCLQLWLPPLAKLPCPRLLVLQRRQRYLLGALSTLSLPIYIHTYMK